MQLPLDLAFRPAFGRDDFLVGPANEAAVLWVDRWPLWPAPALVLEGPPASGKTHLANVWQARTTARVMMGRDLTLGNVPTLLAESKFWVVEEAATADEQPLLHLYNATAEQGGALLLTAQMPPARWGTRLADLSSRLAALPVASIALPDDALIRALLLKLFADRRVLVAADVVDFLTIRMERSFEAARRVVAKIDAASIAERRRITVPFVKQIFDLDQAPNG